MSAPAPALKPAHRGYTKPLQAFADKELLRRVSESSELVSSFEVGRCSAKAWRVERGDICRFVCSEGSQVGDVNLWNADDYSERLYTGKTRQIHAGHLSIGDSLWSNLPHLRPMATVCADTLADRSPDADGFRVHDVLGTRCDPYTHRLMTGQLGQRTCHQNLCAAVAEFGLAESDVHDVFNIFMCTKLVEDEYWIRGSPAVAGDYIELLARQPLVVACSACPQGDVGTACGLTVPPHAALPLAVHIRTPRLLAELQQLL